MPEGDTVWLAARRLDDALAGRRLVATDFRVPALATVDLAGREVTDVASRGKHVLIRVAGGLTVHTHFRMDGTWHLYRPGERWRGGPAWQVRAVLVNDAWQAVGYRLPVIDLLPTAQEHRVVGHLGPDLLGPDWDAAEALRRLSAEPDREIGQALLDQRNLAGIGNLYKTETCFLSGLSPWTPVRNVPDMTRLVVLARRLLEANKATFVQSTTGDTRPGRWHWVFERAGQPCRRCGTQVAIAEQGTPPHQRVAYWCQRCQPGPAPAPLRRGERERPPSGYRKRQP